MEEESKDPKPRPKFKKLEPPSGKRLKEIRAVRAEREKTRQLELQKKLANLKKSVTIFRGVYNWKDGPKDKHGYARRVLYTIIGGGRWTRQVEGVKRKIYLILYYIALLFLLGLVAVTGMIVVGMLKEIM